MVANIWGERFEPQYRLQDSNLALSAVPQG
jgi:hypothetical protein